MVHLKATIASAALVFGLSLFFSFSFVCSGGERRGGANCSSRWRVIIATLGRAQIRGYTHNSYSVNWNVPASGNDLYVQISAETSHGWAATGIGSQMQGALMFVIYPAGNGNVTVSPRLGLLVTLLSSWRWWLFFLMGCAFVVLGANSSQSMSRRLNTNCYPAAAFSTNR